MSTFDGHYEAEVKLAKYAKYASSDDARTLRVLFTRVLQRVIDSGELGKPRCAPTLYLGYTMHDDSPVVVPSVEAP